MVAIVAVLTALLALLTLLPLSRSEVWWVRGLDFPRLQLSALAVALLVAAPLVLDLSRPSNWLIIVVNGLCLVYHGWWILPYTRLHRHEARMATTLDPSRTLRILAVNVLTPNRSSDLLIEQIREWRPDIVIAVETDLWWQNELDRLGAEYPFSVKCPLDNLYGMHLYSRLLLEDWRIQFLVEPDIPSIHTVVVLSSGERVRLHCLHPTPPSPTENPESTERDAELIVVGKSVAEARLPTIVAGDLNDVAWSRTTRLFRKISDLVDPRVGRGMFNTFHARIPLIRWPLDHLFHSSVFELVQMQRLRKIGSDHFPILVELQLTGERREASPAPEPDEEDREWAEEKIREEGIDESDVHTPGE